MSARDNRRRRAQAWLAALALSGTVAGLFVPEPFRWACLALGLSAAAALVYLEPVE